MRLPHCAVQAVARQKFVVGSLGADAAAFYDEYLISIHDGRQPMGNHNNGFTMDKAGKRRLDNRFILRIGVRRSFVKDHNRRILKHSPGNGDTLALPS